MVEKDGTGNLILLSKMSNEILPRHQPGMDLIVRTFRYNNAQLYCAQAGSLSLKA